MYDGVLRRQELLQAMGRAAFDLLINSGQLLPAFRGVYLDAATHAQSPGRTRRRAGLEYADGGVKREEGASAYFCCISAAEEHHLPVEGVHDVFVALPKKRTVAKQPGMRTHTHAAVEETVRTRRDVRLVPIETALIQAFSCLPREKGRQLVIRSVQDGRVSACRVREAVLATTPGRAELLEVLELAEGGSHSELEIKALTGVMRRFGLAHVFERQYSDAIPDRYVPMDFAAVDLKVNVETDGSKYHGPSAQRSADLIRDLDLRALRWDVVRCLHEHVVGHPERIAARIIGTLLEHGWTGRPTTVAGVAIHRQLTSQPADATRKN
jgi:very-short-patch-repair endonuclease